jgi:MFS transporter, Spinster family, sphingosine-1-phosphate transporter
MIRRPGAILALLTGLNLLNYLDRLVVSAVLPKIQEDLELSNFVGGLLATVFLIGYFATSPVFGALGDRMQRKWLITLGVLVWSVATVASGLAKDATTLILARAFVGIGEASYATLAPTIIDDVTPPARKGRALSIFYVAMPVGAALGYLVGGFVEKHWGWRSAFFVAGGPGIVLAFACLLIAEPERSMSSDKPDVLRDLGALVRTVVYRKAVLGYCAYTAAVGAFSYWAPKFLYSRYGLALDVANFRFGLVTLVGGFVGIILGGRWADRPGRASPGGNAGSEERARLAHLFRVCAIGSALAAVLAVAAFLSPGPDLFFAAVFVAIVALFLSTSPINAIILQSVPATLRASAMALSIFAIHVFGDLWSPPLVGLLADHMPIQIAMLTLPVAIALSAWLWWPRRAAA